MSGSSDNTARVSEKRESEREGGREGGREREREWEGGSEEGREREREGGRDHFYTLYVHFYIFYLVMGS